MNKFKKYLSQHPDVAARYEKTGSVVEKPSAKAEETAKKAEQKPNDRSSSKLP